MSIPFQYIWRIVSFSMTLLLVASSLFATPVLASPAQQAITNDDFNTPILIGALPYSHSMDTRTATTAADDPSFPVETCNRQAGLASVWYAFTPTSNASITIDTFGSNYDTMLGVWTGSRGSLTEIACNDDASSVSFASQVTFSASAGVTYYIGVSQFNGELVTSLDQTKPVDVTGQIGGGDLTIHAYVTYNLTKATFIDVPMTDSGWRFIEAMYAFKITSGCNTTSPLKFCPTWQVTREQMAVFVLRAKHGGTYAPPAATGMFSDVPTSSVFAPWVEQIAREGIYPGCGAGKFCPKGNVSRSEMAYWLLRGKYGSAYTPPAPVGIFADMPVSNPATAWVEKLRNDGITSGCNATNYCPTWNVTRWQMSVFLVRTFSIPTPPVP